MIKRTLELEKKCRLRGDADACRDLAWAYLQACEPPKPKDGAAAPDDHACVSLADLYAAGVGVSRRDESRASELYIRACDLGNARGCFASGICLSQGLGVSKDLSAAAEAFALACKQGHPTACYHLGRAYATGNGVPKSQAKSLRVFELACDMGSAVSCENAGILSQLRGNQSKAAELLAKACAKGSVSACERAQKMNFSG